MNRYLPLTENNRKEMLSQIGQKSMESLLVDVFLSSQSTTDLGSMDMGSGGCLFSHHTVFDFGFLCFRVYALQRTNGVYEAILPLSWEYFAKILLKKPILLILLSLMSVTSTIFALFFPGRHGKSLLTAKLFFGACMMVKCATQRTIFSLPTLTVAAKFTLTTFEIPEGIDGLCLLKGGLRYDPATHQIYFKDLRPVRMEFANPALTKYPRSLNRPKRRCRWTTLSIPS